MPEKLERLQITLNSFNGKDPSDAKAFAASSPATPAILSTLFDHLAPPHQDTTQAGAGWLLWEYANKHGWSPDDYAEPIVLAIPAVTDWQARLCLIQTLSLTAIPKPLTPAGYKALQHAAYDENTFVRAWAIGGLINLAGQHPSYRRHVCPIVIEAQESSRPAVKARIRNALKSAGWSVE